jgi:hypothetical protein
MTTDNHPRASILPPGSYSLDTCNDGFQKVSINLSLIRFEDFIVFVGSPRTHNMKQLLLSDLPAVFAHNHDCINDFLRTIHAYLIHPEYSNLDYLCFSFHKDVSWPQIEGFSRLAASRLKCLNGTPDTGFITAWILERERR